MSEEEDLHTPGRERGRKRRGREGGGKKVAVYLHHIPSRKKRRRKNREKEEEEDVSVGDIRELQGSEWTENLQEGGLVFLPLSATSARAKCGMLRENARMWREALCFTLW